MTEAFVGFVLAWSVIDGDTVRVDVHIWPNLNAVQERVRLLGIDTPELRASSECERLLAQSAREYTTKLLAVGKQIVVVVPRAEPNKMRDSFGRLLGQVVVDGVKVSDALISQGLARVYGTKGTWC